MAQQGDDFRYCRKCKARTHHYNGKCRACEAKKGS